jgi:hypothetical protein
MHLQQLLRVVDEEHLRKARFIIERSRENEAM